MRTVVKAVVEHTDGSIMMKRCTDGRRELPGIEMQPGWNAIPKLVSVLENESGIEPRSMERLAPWVGMVGEDWVQVVAYRIRRFREPGSELNWIQIPDLVVGKDINTFDRETGKQIARIQIKAKNLARNGEGEDAPRSGRRNDCAVVLVETASGKLIADETSDTVPRISTEGEGRGSLKITSEMKERFGIEILDARHMIRIEDGRQRVDGYRIRGWIEWQKNTWAEPDQLIEESELSPARIAIEALKDIRAGEERACRANT